MKKCFVYMIKNLVTGRVYVGRSLQPNVKKRWSWHQSTLRNNKHEIKALQNDYNFYGSANFMYKVLERCDLEELQEREQYWIDYMKETNNLYNKRPTAEKVHIATEEEKAKSYVVRSQAQSGEKNPRAKLTEQQVNIIKQLVQMGYQQKKIADLFGVNQPQISRIANGTRW